MPTTDDENQPGTDQGNEPEDESHADEVRRAARPPEVEPGVTEEESILVEEYGERGRSWEREAR